MTTKRKPKTELQAHGLRCLLSPHPEIRRLKRDHRPARHGNKVWKSSWMLMDYLMHHGPDHYGTTLDIGCGWGLTGIFLSKQYNANVTAVDIDRHIEPYLQLHAAINHTTVKFLNSAFEQIQAADLRHVHTIVGTDICFWEELIDPLRFLFGRARRSGVRQIFIADPGRPTFDDLADGFAGRPRTDVVDWEIDAPVYAAGRILRMEFQPGVQTH